MTDYRIKLPQNFNEQSIELLEKLLQPEAGNNFDDFAEVLKHGYFSKESRTTTLD